MDKSTEVRLWLKDHGHNQTWLANTMGISPGYVSSLLNNSCPMRPEHRAVLKKITGIDWGANASPKASRELRRGRSLEDKVDSLSERLTAIEGLLLEVLAGGSTSERANGST